MKINRALRAKIIEKVKTGKKAVIIYGARQVGKTTLSKEIINSLNLRTLQVNADQEKYLDILSSRDLEKMKSLIAGYDLLFIDEAQRIPDIGINLKILVDEMPELKIIATGSSSFDLANKISEPLTGRTWSFTLYPLSIMELADHYSDFELDGLLDNLLVFGSYPEVFTTVNLAQKESLLKEIGRAYLYKDALDLLTVKQAKKVKDLLKLIAFQIGSEVSILELANSLDLSRETVEKYLDLLEKSFVIFRLGGFSRNLRKEVTKMDKIYFYDLGIRNMLVDNFKALKDRNDAGQLWENFLMIERMKMLAYKNISASTYFWRIYSGAELDYVEEKDGKLFGYEFKFGRKKSRFPRTWLETYENSNYEIINKDNWKKFLK
jgi:predicted AAA+ superfamily ATPase